MDRISAVPTFNVPRYSDTTPLINYRAGTVVLPANFVTVLAMRLLGASTAVGFGGSAEGRTRIVFGDSWQGFSRHDANLVGR